MGRFDGRRQRAILAEDAGRGGRRRSGGAHALELFSAVGSANAKHEFYLTDTVEIANARGLKAEYVVGPEEEFLGVNSRDQLVELVLGRR